MEWKRAQQHAVNHAENRRVRADPQRQRQHGNRRETGIFQQHSQTEAQVLNHFILPSLTLEPESVPERAKAPPQQFEFVTPVEPVPSSQQRFAVFQFRFPFLLKPDAEAARHDHADEADQPSPEAKASCLSRTSHTSSGVAASTVQKSNHSLRSAIS